MIKEIIDKLVALLAVSALLASCSESELWQTTVTVRKLRPENN